MIDVLIPAFNAAATITGALASIQRQTLSPQHIVVVDDGSADATPAILSALAADDPRLHVIRQPNRGIVAALNAGLAHCSADYVARMDADDISAPERFAMQCAWLDAHPACVAVSGVARHIDADGRFLGTEARLPSPDLADPAWIPAREPYLLHPFLMARRETLQALGGYRHVVYAEDSDLFWRMQEVGTLDNMDDVLGDYRMDAQSISGASLRNGHIMAVSSQRAAFSAARRRLGKTDLMFPAATAAGYREAASLRALLDIAREGLSPGERAHFDAAVAGKLLELAAYRPYELDMDDCRFVRSALERYWPRLRPVNRAKLAQMSAGAAARLLHGGEWRKALALAPPGSYPGILSRLALRVTMPRGLRMRLKGALGRGSQELHAK